MKFSNKFLFGKSIEIFKIFFLIRSGILPPIESGAWQIAPHNSKELVHQEKRTELIHRRLNVASTHIKETLDRTCLLDKPRPNVLPPIKSFDGFPDRINLPLQKSMVMKNQLQMTSTTTADHTSITIKCSPRKRAKTHTIIRSSELSRGDSWELLKAEKIRCVELSKYEKKLEAERKQKGVKKFKKGRKNNDSSRPVGRVSYLSLRK